MVGFGECIEISYKTLAFMTDVNIEFSLFPWKNLSTREDNNDLNDVLFSHMWQNDKKKTQRWDGFVQRDWMHKQTTTEYTETSQGTNFLCT